MSEPSAEIIADSINEFGNRLTTMEVVMHRFVLAEFNTHRTFCLAGDSVLEFDLPAGTRKTYQRVHKMTIADFVDKWHHGSAPRKNGGRYRQGDGTNRQPMKGRLSDMSIRQLNEETGLIQTSHVVDAMFSGEKQIYQVQAGKHFIAGSADHRIYTPDGYVTIGDLRRGDEIVVRRKGKREEDLALDDFKKVGGRWRSVWQRHQRQRLLSEFGGCQMCSATESLVIHHIVEVSRDPSLAFEESNILLLCADCHHDQHRNQDWQSGQYLYGDSVTVDRIGKCGTEPTFDLEISGDYPNFLANGVVVHNSRNSASSRAIPVKKQLERVKNDLAYPLVWPAEKPGMQGGESLSDAEAAMARLHWTEAMHAAVEYAEKLLELGVHKSVTNRLLEPFMWHTVIVSSTEWENFFDLRCNPLAQPEIQASAYAMKKAYRDSIPTLLTEGEWHLPYVLEDERGYPVSLLRKISSARCARVSYLTHDGERNLDKDLELFNRLASADPAHSSPMEHVARPIRKMEYISRGNFKGWQQFRHEVERVKEEEREWL